MEKITSAAASKMIKTLEEEKSYILSLENRASTYVLADGEKTEAPEYDYEKTQARINEIDAKVRKIKHALNVFNTTTRLEKLDITIDEALVEMAQLNRSLAKLGLMKTKLPKERVQSYNSGRQTVVEYCYVNYDISKAEKDYENVLKRITDIQLALDLTNQTVLFELDI